MCDMNHDVDYPLRVATRVLNQPGEPVMTLTSFVLTQGRRPRPANRPREQVR